ncbi:SDR family oxidoreductase [Nonomuraea sp. K274]|uniref:SDR family oxidoreductase n=1 Tax=Nonomuraea cypriaca TaxID=1187855 RepID=A0A931AIN6_9ACTN|nr:SDR family oxidoreductase [Nonomuraea cypriaca]MBF8192643.1 SDR family oxidoreductase [Nonomuraea cypriaca]
MAALSPDAILLTGRVAVVTGAARGIGQAIAGAFAAFGAHVAVCDRDKPQAELAMTLDVRDHVAVEVFAQAVRERWGRVDVLVNNAGGTFHAPFEDTSPRGEQILIEENLTQVTGMIRQFVPMMPPGGSIINVTSGDAHRAAPGFAVHAAMKAGLESLTKSLALELAPKGVRVNAIAPDALQTEGETGLRERMLTRPLPYDPVRLPPLGRLGAPGDAAGAAVFLAGDLARFVTGTTVHVDGGINAAGGWRRT